MIAGGPILLTVSFGAGSITAWLYFGSLRLTVEALASARRPLMIAVWALLLRLAVICAVFAGMALLGGVWCLLVGFAGFLATRAVMLSRPWPAHREQR